VLFRSGLIVGEEELKSARALVGETGEGVVFVVGRPNMAEDSQVMENAIRHLAERYPRATFLPALRRANVMGALDMGLAPQLRPGRGFSSEGRGRDALAQLNALRSGEQTALLLLGGALRGNVLDVAGATEALELADVVVVTGHGGSTLAYADVVLPAAVQFERTGTVTNIEGRVTAVAPKIVAPGSAWPDVAIASELAEELGQSIGLSSVEEAARAIEETTGYPALSVLGDSSDDGVVVGDASERTTRRPLDPMAFPGIRSTETVGLGAHTGSTTVSDVETATTVNRATWDQVDAGHKVDVPLADAYSLRVHLSRRLYDNGVAVQGTPALAALKVSTVLHLNHFDLDRLGATTGDVVGVTGARGSVRLPVALDDAVPRGATEIAFGSVDGDGNDVLRSIFDGNNVIAQVRLDTK